MMGDTAAFRGLMLVALLSPLPLGSDRPWAWSLLALLVALLCAWWAGTVVLRRGRTALTARHFLPTALPFGLALLWAMVQAGSLPPASWWNPLWTAVAVAPGGAAPAGAVSADPELTRTALMRLVCYGGIFWLAAQLGRDRDRARRVLVGVALAGTLYALYGLIVHFTGSETILGMEKTAYRGDVTATFINRNTYGTYAGLGLLCAVALFAHGLRRRAVERSSGAFDLAETVLVKALPHLAAALILGSALLLSHSRGALLACGAGIAVLMATLAAGRIMTIRAAVGTTLLVLAVALVLLLVSGEVTLNRLAEAGTTDLAEERLNAYRLTIQAILDAPFSGMGLGAFVAAFQMYRDQSLANPAIWDSAHNVHLELVMDLGIPGALAFYAALAAVLGTCLRGLLQRRRDQIYPAVALAVAALAGIHGLMDFSPQVPAVAATLSLLLGVGYAQSWSTDRRKAEGGASHRKTGSVDSQVRPPAGDHLGGPTA